MVGIWMDEERVIQIFPDYNVAFLKALRPVNLLSVKEPGVFDDASGLFSFTVKFPPDKSNPHGIAHWHLHESGMVDVTFTSEVPKYGKAMPEARMIFQPVE